jgi:hypothetical protein
VTGLRVAILQRRVQASHDAEDRASQALDRRVYARLRAELVWREAYNALTDAQKAEYAARCDELRLPVIPLLRGTP